MKHWYFIVGSLLVICSSVSFSSASFLEKETDGNIIKLGSRKIIRQMKRIDSAKAVDRIGLFIPQKTVGLPSFYTGPLFCNDLHIKGEPIEGKTTNFTQGLLGIDNIGSIRH